MNAFVESLTQEGSPDMPALLAIVQRVPGKASKRERKRNPSFKPKSMLQIDVIKRTQREIVKGLSKIQTTNAKFVALETEFTNPQDLIRYVRSKIHKGEFTALPGGGK